MRFIFDSQGDNDLVKIIQILNYNMEQYKISTCKYINSNLGRLDGWDFDGRRKNFPY